MKMMPAIEGVKKDFFWDANDTGLYGYYNNINSNSGPVGDWFASHKEVIEKIPHNKRQTVIQAGGAFGMYPILLRNYFQTVHTFEPDPINYNILCKNIQHHKVSNIHSHNIALSLEDCTLIFAQSPESGNRGTSLVHPQGNTQVDATSIDNINIENVDFIWLDIEGYEYEALQGAIKTIRKYSPIIAIERPSEKVFEFLNALGYLPWKNSKMDVFFVK